MSLIRQALSFGIRVPQLGRSVPALVTSIRFNSSASASASAAPVDAKISQIVDQISTLTLLETSSLVSELKSRLNISDIALPVGGGAGAGASAQAAPVEEEEAKVPVEEKTIFSIKLESFDAKSKPKIIKEVKGLLGLSLVESKKFVESAPKILKENVAKEDADKIKSTLEGLGAKVSLE
ncbi:MNP1 [Candida oxycetoniae]|uniref:MNP1 n=1 Tax=Candida oxycetoniae TaxID=497107 RepID=A0AAI9SVH8_9ASCO|nr:MNP1 [Candida oxycetoniae]KAI3403479.1 MNP1 [Candida oxycetoniae]